MGSTVFVVMMIYSALGTIFEMAADRAYEVLADNNWYQLPVDEQRIIILVLIAAQRPSLLMAGTLPLNMMTGVQAVKTVYSVGMMLVQTAPH